MPGRTYGRRQTRDTNAAERLSVRGTTAATGTHRRDGRTRIMFEEFRSTVVRKEYPGTRGHFRGRNEGPAKTNPP